MLCFESNHQAIFFLIQIDSKKIGLIAKGGDKDYSLLKTCCLSKKTTTTNETGYNITQTNCLKKCKVKLFQTFNY